MKRTICFLLLSISMGYAQEVALVESGSNFNYKPSRSTSGEERLLKTEDFKSANGRMLVSELTCRIRNEDVTNTVLISVVCQQKAFDQLGVDKINDMILAANNKIRNSVSFGHRYNPKEIKMAYFPDSNDWSLTNAFSVEDQTGAKKERLFSVDFDANGKLSKMKTIL